MFQKEMEQRKSIRKYTADTIPGKELQELKKMLKEQKPMFMDATFRLELFENHKKNEAKLGYLFGMGRIKAPYCIAGIFKGEDKNMVEVGIALEKVVLYLTRLGLGTCYLGTFDREAVARMVHLSEGEHVGIVVALGYPAEGFMNSGFRRLAGSTKRRAPEEISSYLDYKRGAGEYLKEHPRIREAVRLATLAPSANNLQPVRVVFKDGRAEVYIINGSYVDAGIFLTHFYFGLQGAAAKLKMVAEPPAISPEKLEYVASICFGE